MESNEIQMLYTKRASFYHFFFLDFLGVGRRIENFFRQSDYVRSHAKILDAGCGTGNVTRALYAIAHEKGYEDVTFHAFDLTQAMLDVFQRWIKNVGANNIALKQANVLSLEQLPSHWNAYDLIVSSGMLEHVPKDTMRQALSDLKRLLKHHGKFVVFITRRTIVTKLFIERWWKAHTYKEQELQQIFHEAGFRECTIVKTWWGSTIALEAG